MYIPYVQLWVVCAVSIFDFFDSLLELSKAIMVTILTQLWNTYIYIYIYISYVHMQCTCVFRFFARFAYSSVLTVSSNCPNDNNSIFHISVWLIHIHITDVCMAKHGGDGPARRVAIGSRRRLALKPPRHIRGRSP